MNDFHADIMHQLQITSPKKATPLSAGISRSTPELGISRQLENVKQDAQKNPR